MPFLEFDIGRVTLSENDDDGFDGIQVDAYGEEESGVIPYEAHHFFGFSGRPLDPEMDSTGEPNPEKSGQVLTALEGGRGHSWAMEDPRVMDRLPQKLPGESIMYGGAGQFIRCHQSGAISICTTDQGGALEGNPVTLQVTSKGLFFVAPWGRIVFDATGLHMVTQHGARLDLGAMAGLSDLGLGGTYAVLSADNVTLDGPNCSSGPTGAADNATKFAPLAAYLAAMRAELVALEAAVAALPGGTAVTTAIATPVAATTAAATTFTATGAARQTVT